MSCFPSANLYTNGPFPNFDAVSIGSLLDSFERCPANSPWSSRHGPFGAVSTHQGRPQHVPLKHNLYVRENFPPVLIGGFGRPEPRFRALCSWSSPAKRQKNEWPEVRTPPCWVVAVRMMGGPSVLFLYPRERSPPVGATHNR